MGESIDVPIPANMLESMGMFKAAQKELLDQIKELKKNIKLLEKEGKAIPPDVQDRLARLEQDKVRVQAKQVAKVAAEESVAHVHKKFTEFERNLGDIKSVMTSRAGGLGSVLGNVKDRAISGLFGMIEESLSQSGGQIAKQGSKISGALSSQAASSAGKTASGAVKAAGGAAGVTSRMAGPVGSLMESIGGAAGLAKGGIIGAALWVGKRYIDESANAYKMQAEINRKEFQLQSELFNASQDAMFSSQRSVDELMAERESVQEAKDTVGTDWFNPAEVIAGLKAKNFVVDKLKDLFGQTGEKSKRERGVIRAEQNRKHHEFARRLGKGWEEATNVENMISHAKTEPNSVMARKYATAHSLYGSGNFLAYMRGVVGPGVTDEELRTLGYKYRDDFIKTIQEARMAEEKVIKKNPTWRVNEHERGVWIEEVGKHRYERTLAWVKS